MHFIIFFLWIGSVVVQCTRADVFEHKQPRPNVLFLAVDDMKDWVNCLGGYEGTVLIEQCNYTLVTSARAEHIPFLSGRLQLT